MADPFENLQSIDRYQVIRIIGRGGMGVVYLARDPKLQRDVAIKCVDKRQRDTQLVKRLRSEARLLAQLNHVNIVQLYDVIETDDILGLVIEYVKGATILEKCKELLPTIRQRLEWLQQVSKGLEVAHKAGIVHCDLKPENVLITHDGNVKIADFGIAKARLGDLLDDDGLTKMDHVSGSYFSLSPEQATGQAVDFRTDLFSLGILIHLVLTEHHPFNDSNNHIMVVQQIINDKFVPSADTKTKLSKELIGFISVLLEKKPEHRPVTTNAVTVCLGNELKRMGGEQATADDLTVELAVMRPQRSKMFSNSIKPVVAGLAILIVGALIYWLQPAPKTIYVAVTEPQITAEAGLDPEQQTRIVDTLKYSLQEALLSYEQLSLVPDSALDQYDGDIARMAKATAADVVILADANCNVLQCEVRLQKLKADGVGNWVIKEQNNWPVIADKLSDVRLTTLSEFPLLFPNELQQKELAKLTTVSEQDYRDYLQVYKESSRGTGATDQTLLDLDRLKNNSPNFLPIYWLYTKAAIHLNKRTGKDSYLQRLENTLNVMPRETTENTVALILHFDLMLQREDIARAKSLLQKVQRLSGDRVLINQMRSDLAFTTNDLATVLELDRDNALLRPSVLSYYNLAYSEYSFGNFSDAKVSLQRALALFPTHAYSQNLKTAIALVEGDLPTAITAYEVMVSANPDSENLSNYGVALALNGDYKRAIEIQRQAIELNPNVVRSHVNLADFYKLSGDLPIAKISYQRALQLTEALSSARDYTYRAQAQAHLGQYAAAIKTLRSAESKFSSITDLFYTAAIVHTLSGNNSAAVVEVESARNSGTGAIWFQFPWFKSLCADSNFSKLIEMPNGSICSVKAL